MYQIQTIINSTPNQYSQLALQKTKAVTFGAKKKAPRNFNDTFGYNPISLFNDFFREQYLRKNENLLLDFCSLHNMNLKNLRIINENVVSGATLERRTDKELQKIKESGIRKVIDLRSEATSSYARRCKNMGFEYYNIPFNDVYNLRNSKYFIHKKNQPTEVTEDFIKILREMFKIVNSGDVFLGCEYGIDRTNIALVLNYLLNKETKCANNSDNAPLLLTWPEENRKEVFNRNVKAVKKIFRLLSEKQKKELNLGASYDIVLKERITKLFLRNKNLPFGRYL